METPNTTKTAWSPSGIAWLAVFFSFLPAGILYAYNYGRLGKSRLKRPFIIGVSVAAIFVFISLFTTDLNKNFYQFINIIAALLFYSSQKSDFQKFLNEGGKKASFKLPVLYCFIFSGLLIAAIFGLEALQTKTKPLVLVNNRFENTYISGIVPKGWTAYENEPGDTDTLVYLVKDNGIANISIDHDQHFLNTPNSSTTKNYDPTDVLYDRLKSIEESTKADPKVGWENFKGVGEIKEIDIKGLRAAEGHFIVDEKILGQKTERKIKRIVVFTDDDLYNIVFAAADKTKFQEEEKAFNEFMNSLTIK